MSEVNDPRRATVTTEENLSDAAGVATSKKAQETVDIPPVIVPGSPGESDTSDAEESGAETNNPNEVESDFQAEFGLVIASENDEPEPEVDSGHVEGESDHSIGENEPTEESEAGSSSQVAKLTKELLTGLLNATNAHREAINSEASPRIPEEEYKKRESIRRLHDLMQASDQLTVDATLSHKYLANLTVAVGEVLRLCGGEELEELFKFMKTARSTYFEGKGDDKLTACLEANDRLVVELFDAAELARRVATQATEAGEALNLIQALRWHARIALNQAGSILASLNSPRSLPGNEKFRWQDILLAVERFLWSAKKVFGSQFNIAKKMQGWLADATGPRVRYESIPDRLMALRAEMFPLGESELHSKEVYQAMGLEELDTRSFDDWAPHPEPLSESDLADLLPEKEARAKEARAKSKRTRGEKEREEPAPKKNPRYVERMIDELLSNDKASTMRDFSL